MLCYPSDSSFLPSYKSQFVEGGRGFLETTCRTTCPGAAAESVHVPSKWSFITHSREHRLWGCTGLKFLPHHSQASHDLSTKSGRVLTTLYDSSNVYIAHNSVSSSSANDSLAVRGIVSIKKEPKGSQWETPEISKQLTWMLS